MVFGPEPTNIALANSFIIINVGRGPTDDDPTVTREPPSDPDRVCSFLKIRVADIHAVYAEWSARGAQFLTPPKQHQYEIRCYIRDLGGYIIEVGQTAGLGAALAPRVGSGRACDPHRPARQPVGSRTGAKAARRTPGGQHDGPGRRAPE